MVEITREFATDEITESCFADDGRVQHGVVCAEEPLVHFVLREDGVRLLEEPAHVDMGRMTSGPVTMLGIMKGRLCLEY